MNPTIEERQFRPCPECGTLHDRTDELCSRCLLKHYDTEELEDVKHLEERERDE